MCYQRLHVEGLQRKGSELMTGGLVIEREVLIEAPADLVWCVITEPDQICLWFADQDDLVAEPGAITALWDFEGTNAVRAVIGDRSRGRTASR
jgi:uncharacterized protein YndB with AHSA1/START domain